jgi:uncharacterized membrane protein YbhN (UPF0104 family)
VAARGRQRLLRAVLGGVAAVLVVVALVNQWKGIRGSLDELSVATVVAAFVLVVAGTVCGGLAWRAILADLGSPLPPRAAAHVFFLSQLGKYVPGSVWNVVAQIELARDHHVPRRRSAAAAVLALAITTTVALVLAATGIALVGNDPPIPAGLLYAVAAAGVLLLHPPLLSALLNRALRLVRREPLERPISRRGVLTAIGWNLVAWLCYGGHVWLLARDLGARGSSLLPVAVAAFAGAWAAGFLFLVAPAGAGAREAALVLGLSGVLSTAGATLVAVVSRLLFTVSDLLLSGTAMAGARTRQTRHAVQDLAEPGSP